MKPSSHPPAIGPRRREVLLALLVVGLAFPSGTGCRVVRTTASVPERTVRVFFPGGKQNQPAPANLQQSLMRVADNYTGEMSESVEEILGTPDSPFTPRGALEFKLATATAAISVATRDNPYAGLFDTASLVTLTRMSLEHHQSTATNAATWKPWIQRIQRVETNVWDLAAQVLSDEQQQNLRQSVDQYFTAKKESWDDFLLEPLRMASALPRTVQAQQGSGGLFELAAIDPFASLDPAVREVTETRLFAERAMYTLQRMPWLLRGQVELLLLDATAQPQVAKALEDSSRLSEGIDRISRAAEEVSRTAAALPAQISSEREALVKALETQEGKLTPMLNSATELSDSLNTTLVTFDALMKRFGVGEPDTNAPPPDPNAKPFDILDYAKTAEQVTAMAKELNVAINELNTTLDSPALDKLSQEATGDVRGLLNHAFLLAVSLVVLIFGCALAYRLVLRSSKR
jgi:hypothetical protein